MTPFAAPNAVARKVKNPLFVAMLGAAAFALCASAPVPAKSPASKKTPSVSASKTEATAAPAAGSGPSEASEKGWSDYKKNYVGKMQEYTAKKEDAFVYIARKYNLGYVELRAANPDVDPWLPGTGAALVLPTMHLLPQAPRRGIVVNLPEMRLYSYDESGKPPHTYAIGIGREGLNTPTGTTKVVRKIDGPTWRPTARMRLEDPTLPEVVPPGPANPLGTHALYTDWSEYRIHGTDKPFGIGRRVSSGCMRLYPEGIIDLYKHTEVGAPINVINQPVKAAWIGDEFYIEAHPSIEQADQMEEEGRISTYRLSEDDFRLILQVAGDRADSLDWDLIRETVRERKGYPVLVGRAGGFKDKEDRTAKLEAVTPVPVSDRQDKEAALSDTKAGKSP